MTTKVSPSMLEAGSDPVGQVPIGTPVATFRTAVPDANWLFCNGQAVSRATYAALFAAIGTVGGAGDGSATFNIPDLRGRVLTGRDNMGGTPANRVTAAISGLAATTLGAVGGDQELQAHNHTATVNDGGHNHTVSARANDTPNTFLAAGDGSAVGSQTTSTSFTGVTVDISTIGGGNSHNIAPTIVVNWIMRVS